MSISRYIYLDCGQDFWKDSHLDYTLGGRITLVENEGFLFYSNKGTFIPKSMEKVLKEKGHNRNIATHALRMVWFISI